MSHIFMRAKSVEKEVFDGDFGAASSSRRRPAGPTPLEIGPITLPGLSASTLQLTRRDEGLVLEGSVWLHAVYDGHLFAGTYRANEQGKSEFDPMEGVLPGFVYSVEIYDEYELCNVVLATRFDPENPFPDPGDWQHVVHKHDIADVSYTDSGGSTGKYVNLSDHWHIFAYDRHWIACSLLDIHGDATGALLVKFELTQDNTVNNKVPGEIWAAIGSASYDFGGPTGAAVPLNPTNDLFLVADSGVPVTTSSTSEGLAIGLSKPANSTDVTSGHTIVRADQSLIRYGSVPLAADAMTSTWAHVNEASARQASESGEAFRVLAPETILYDSEGSVLYIETEITWAHISDGVYIRHEQFENLYLPERYVAGSTHVSMATHAQLIGGYWAVAYKVNETSSTPPASDGGRIFLEIRKGGFHGHVIQRESDIHGNRPHLMFAKGWLILTWDGAGPSSDGSPKAGTFVRTYHVSLIPT